MLHVLYMGVNQTLEVYHQDTLESGKYSSLNVVQLWDDLHHTLTSLTNKFIPSKLSTNSTSNILPWVNQKLKRIARQRDRAFQKHRKSGKPADRKKFLDLKHLFRKSINLFYLEDILDVASKLSQMIFPPNPIQTILTLLKHSKQDSASVAPLHKHNSVHQDDPTKATDADRSMLDITVTSKGIEKLLSNLNPHKAAGPDQIKHIILKNRSTPLSPILKHLF